MKKNATVLSVFVLFSFCLGILLLNSCSKGQQDIGGQNQGGYNDSKFAAAADYFPMKTGHIWYYSVYYANSTDTFFDYNLEGRIDSGFGRTNYYIMPDGTMKGYMFWGSTRGSEISAGGGYLFHTRLMDSSTSYEEVLKVNSTLDQAQIGGLHTVVTAAGTFSCIRNEIRYFQNDSIHLVRYFAKDLGRVKEEKYKIVDGIIYPIYIQTLDSTSF